MLLPHRVWRAIVGPVINSTVPPKSFPGDSAGLTTDEMLARGWRAPVDFSTPLAVLSQPALDNNHQVMARWVADHGVRLAPHGKTTMTPLVIEQQLAAGVWGMTAATPWQAQTMVAAGARNVIIANETLDPYGLAWVRTAMESDPGLTIWVYVDSVVGAQRVAERLGTGDRLVPVLLEVGLVGGRGGVRDLDTGVAVAEAVRELSGIELAGVAAFEGVYGDRLDEILAMMTTMINTCREQKLISDRPMFTAGGSGAFDAVAAAAAKVSDVDVVIRSGCYVAHDDGLYADTSPLKESLQPALRVWARVISLPEPELALVDAGKRDLTAEGVLPIVTAIIRNGERLPGLDVRVDRFNDQHGYLLTDQLQVDDLVELGISHACLTFDKWRHIPVVDADGTVINIAETVF
ncbi:alanine racemase [Propionibacteriaceae bacterium Y1685]